MAKLAWHVLIPLRLQSLPYPSHLAAPRPRLERTSPFPADLMHIAVTSRYIWLQIILQQLCLYVAPTIGLIQDWGVTPHQSIGFPNRKKFWNPRGEKMLDIPLAPLMCHVCVFWRQN